MNSLEINYWLKQHWKLLVIIFVAVAILAEVIFQIVYPSSRLIAGTKVDGLDVGGMRKDDAAKKLDEAYGGLKLNIYFGKNDAAFQAPKMSEVGVGVDNDARIAVIDYPFWLRIVPGSIFWAPALQKPGDIEYTYNKDKIAEYTQSKVGTDCNIAPKNASLKLVDSQLQLTPSATGGICDITQFQQALAQVQPDPDKDNSIRIAIDETPAPVSDDMARELAAKLNTRMAAPMPIVVDNATDSIPGRVVLSWLDFKADVPEQTIDNTGNQTASLQFNVNPDRMKSYLNQGIASKLIVKPGVSKVTTYDFTETARSNGAKGRDINVTGTVQSVTDYINSKNSKAIGATQVVDPVMQYTRDYSPTSNGFRALLTHYAQDNPGTWGLAFTEVAGISKPRSATYNADAKFPAAGIHSLYLAYTDVIQQKNGASRPVDIIAGNTNATECFKKMLSQFDQPCTDGFYDFYGHATLTARARDLGLQNTVFAGRQTQTSANDLQKVMIGLYKNQIARVEGGQKILSMIRSVRDNDGIPAGISRGSASHIIGQNETIHNDTAIVSSTGRGIYVLTVMSDGASWDSVAGLVKKIEALKTKKIPKDAT